MRLTVYTDYSLRVLMYVALHPERRPTIAEVASTYGISKNHIMKVVYQLGRAGYVASRVPGRARQLQPGGPDREPRDAARAPRAWPTGRHRATRLRDRLLAGLLAASAPTPRR